MTPEYWFHHTKQLAKEQNIKAEDLAGFQVGALAELLSTLTEDLPFLIIAAETMAKNSEQVNLMENSYWVKLVTKLKQFQGLE